MLGRSALLGIVVLAARDATTCAGTVNELWPGDVVVSSLTALCWGNVADGGAGCGGGGEKDVAGGGVGVPAAATVFATVAKL